VTSRNQTHAPKKRTGSLPCASSLKVDAQRAICGVAAVPLAPVAPDRAGVQCTHAAGAVDGSTAGCPWVKFSLQWSLWESRIFSASPLKLRGSMKRAYGNCG